MLSRSLIVNTYWVGWLLLPRKMVRNWWSESVFHHARVNVQFQWASQNNSNNSSSSSSSNPGTSNGTETSLTQRFEEGFNLIKNISFQWILGIFSFGVLLLALCLLIYCCKRKHRALNDQYQQRELAESAAVSAVNVNSPDDASAAYVPSRPASSSAAGLPSRDGLSTGNSTRSSYLTNSGQSWDTQQWPSRPNTGTFQSSH